jgi:signal transduction histidine kinase
MFRQKIAITLLWSAACIAAAMAADYAITILLLHNIQGYTPAITFAIATLITVPTTYLLVSSSFKLRQARDELAEARDAAINANLSKTLFFANMSHELRTPLNAILGFSQLLRSDMFAGKRVEYAGLINDAGSHLLNLVNDLLDVSKIEAGQLQLDSADVALGEIAEACCSIIEPRARTARLKLVRNIDGNLPPVRGDKRALKQIMLNLLTNAVKFSEAGGTVEVFVKYLATGELAFGVRDDGIGIAPDDQARVFERYGRARHEVTQVQEGTGLGLPIVKGLADAHNARVTLESTLGEGTCITSRLFCAMSSSGSIPNAAR